MGLMFICFSMSFVLYAGSRLKNKRDEIKYMNENKDKIKNKNKNKFKNKIKKD